MSLQPLRRVARRQVILTFDHEMEGRFWLSDYVPAMTAQQHSWAATIEGVTAQLEHAQVEVMPVPHDCVDGFMAALRTRAGSSRESAGVRAAHSLVRRRLREHHDLTAVGDAVRANLRARPFDDFGALSAIEGPVLVVGTRDELDPRHPYELARSYVRAIPGSRFECEGPGAVPLGWGGRRLILLVRELAGRAEWGAENSAVGRRRA